MSVTATVGQLQYAGAGSVGPFPVTFPFVAAGDLEVQTVDPLGNVATLVYPRDYSVSGGAVAGSSIPQTGSITLTNALASLWSMTIDRGGMAPNQPLSLPTAGQMPAKSLEAAYDRVTLLIQQLLAVAGRQLQQSASDPITSKPLTLPALAGRMVAGALLGFDPTSGAPIISTPSFTTTNVPVAGIVQVVDTIALLKALAAPSSAVTYLVRGYHAVNDGGGGTFRWNSADTTTDNGGTIIQLTAGGNGRFDRLYDPGTVTVRWFGAKGDGSTDDSGAFNAAFVVISVNGGKLVIPTATYTFASQVTITAPTSGHLLVEGNGSTFTTSGAISGFKITGGSFLTTAVVRSLTVNHAGNASATAGFDLVGACRTTVEDCMVQADSSVGATYAAYQLRNTTPSNDATGCFWCRLSRCGTNVDSGAIPIGVNLVGDANATVVRDCQLSNCTTCIQLKNDTTVDIPNGVVVDGTAFEAFTTGILVTGATTSNIAGLRFINNRFESGTTAFSFTVITSQPATPPWLAGNWCAFSVTNYISNANGLYVQQMDLSITPEIDPILITDKGITIQSLNGSSPAAKFRPGGGNLGIQILTGDGTAVAAQLVWTGTGKGANLRGTSPDYLSLTGILSLGLGSAGSNLRGTATFAAGTTKAIAFGTAEPDNSYYIALGPQDTNIYWVSNKTASGFTINSSGSTSAAIDWILIR